MDAHILGGAVILCNILKQWNTVSCFVPEVLASRWVLPGNATETLSEAGARRLCDYPVGIESSFSCALPNGIFAKREYE
jgi:hypothetical protein